MTEKQPILAYLACPYNHPDPSVKEERHHLVNFEAAQLIADGIFVVSPLTHNIPLFKTGLRQGWDLWKSYDFTIIKRCDKLIVLKLNGWELSKGVADEIAYAQELNLPVEYLDPPSNVSH